MRNITTILRGLQSKPQLVAEDFASSVLEALENKDLSMFQGSGPEEELRVRSVSESTGSKEPKPTVAVMEIDGALTYKAQPCSGLTSYVQIKSTFNALVKDGFKTVVLEVSSPGGQAYMCFETANYLRKVADESDIRLIAYVDGQAASGGYVLSSVCHEIISNPMSSVGSIGAIISLRNDMPKDIADGKERIFITDKGGKTPFTKEGNISQTVIDKMQDDINELGAQFDQHVSDYRNIPVKDIQTMDAESFPAKQALELRLVDKLMEKEEFYSYLSTIMIEDKEKEGRKLADAKTQEELAALVTQLQNDLATTNAKLTDEQAEKDKMVNVLQEIATQREVEAKVAFSSKVEAFSFIGAEEVADVSSILFKLDSESQTKMLSVFAAAQAASVDTKTALEEGELFTKKSLSGDGDNAETEENKIDDLVAQLLAPKGAK